MSRQSKQTKSEKAIFGRLSKIEIAIQNLERLYAIGDLSEFEPLGKRVLSRFCGSGYLRAMELSEEEIWIDRDGRAIPIRDLSNGHLDNIVRWLLEGVDNSKSKLIRDYMKGISGHNYRGKVDQVTKIRKMTTNEFLSMTRSNWRNLIHEQMHRKGR